MHIEYELSEEEKVVGIEVHDARALGDFVDELHQNPQISTFKITNPNEGLPVEDCIVLIQLLATLDNLCELSLNVNELMTSTASAGPALALLLHRNKLHFLDLFGDTADCKLFFAPVIEALASNSSLKHLDLYCENFGVGVYDVISKIIIAKGITPFQITLGGFGTPDGRPLPAQEGYINFLSILENPLYSTNIIVTGHKTLPNFLTLYSEVVRRQNTRETKRLQRGARAAANPRHTLSF